MSVYRRAMGPRRDRALAMLADARLVRAMPDHVLLYSLPESYARLSFLHGGPLVTVQQCEGRNGSTPLSDLSEELRRQAARVLAVASDLLIVDQSFAELAPLGLRCAKVLAPGLLPVTFGHQYRRISYARLNQVARHWGVDTIFTPKNVNPWPHNFP
jgi:ribosomal protein S12 methylthiotransferase accessory factor